MVGGRCGLVYGPGRGTTWRAWTYGKARAFSKRFDTWEAAFAHAQMVAAAFATGPTEQAIVDLMRDLAPNLDHSTVLRYVERYVARRGRP